MQSRIPIRVGAIGCGAAMELLYAGALRRHEARGWIRVAVLADATEARRAWAATAFPKARVDSDLSRLYVARDVALTIVSSPPPLHALHAVTAMAHGSHVLCEKPIADTVEAATMITASAKEHQRLLGVGMTRRFYPCLAQARAWITEGRIGRVRSYSYREGGVYSWAVKSSAPFKRESSGGGVLLDKGVHVLDSLSWLFGPAGLKSAQDDAWSRGVEGNSVVTLSHQQVEGRVQLSWDQDLHSGFLIRGDQGDLMMPVGPIDVLYHRNPGGDWSQVPLSISWPGDLEATPRTFRQPRNYYDCIDLQLIQVLRAILHGEPVPVGGDAATQTLELISKAYQSATWLEQPWLQREEQEASRLGHWRAGS